MPSIGGQTTRAIARFLRIGIWCRLELPAALIIVHLSIAALLIISIASLELLLQLAGLGGKHILGTQLTFSEWMFNLELVTSSITLLVGFIKATVALVRS
jgi:hypothetical protein